MTFSIRSMSAAAVLAPLALLACSAGDGQSTAIEDPSALAEFAPYCTGTLLVDKALMEPEGPASWESSNISAAAGTVFLIEESYGYWEGYVILAGGTAAKIDSDWGTGLVKDVDFESDCAVTGAAQFVLLQDSKFYQDEALTGEPCIVSAGTEFENYTFSALDVAQFSSDSLEAICGFPQGHSDDIVYAHLLPRKANAVLRRAYSHDIAHADLQRLDSDNKQCDPAADTTDCGTGEVEPVNGDTCLYANDGHCDEPDSCDPGTDTTDCRLVDELHDPASGRLPRVPRDQWVNPVRPNPRAAGFR